MYAILRHLNEFEWNYIHERKKLILLGYLQRIEDISPRERDDIMIYAAEFGSKKIVNELIEKSNIDNVMNMACLRGLLNSVKLLISCGAKTFNSGLYYACFGGHPELAELMIQHGADNFNGGLYASSMANHMGLVKLMVQYGANNYDSANVIALWYKHNRIPLYFSQIRSR